MNYSKITEDLYLGTMPNGIVYEDLRKLGVGLVINMRFWLGRRPPKGEPAIEYLRLRTVDTPLLPMPIEALRRGAEAALKAMENGAKVYVHCAKGRHRGAAMAAAILIAQGMPAEEAIGLIQARRKQADPGAGYIKRRIMLFAEQWLRDESEPGWAEPEEGAA